MTSQSTQLLTCTRLIPAHELAANLGSRQAKGLMFFHAFTGCDSTSAFNGVGKKTFWQTWKSLPEMDSAFEALVDKSANVQEFSDILQKFVVLAYDKNIQTDNINKAREVLFSKGKRALDKIPPTAAALEQHANRAFFQAALIWGQALIKNPAVPSTASYGWKEEGGILWTKLPEASMVCRELLKCSCKKVCKGRCANLMCLQ